MERNRSFELKVDAPDLERSFGAAGEISTKEGPNRSRTGQEGVSHKKIEKV